MGVLMADGCDDPTVGTCAEALTVPSPPPQGTRLADRGAPMTPSADSTVELELSSEYLEITMREMSKPIPEPDGVWPEGGIEVTGISLGEQGSTTLPPGLLAIHFHPMTNLGDTTKAPVSLPGLNYTLTTRLTPYLADGDVIVRLDLVSIFSNSEDKEIARLDEPSGTLTCTEPINAVDEAVIHALNHTFVIGDTTFPMPTGEITNLLHSMLGEIPALRGFGVTSSRSGLNLGWSFDVAGNLPFGPAPFPMREYFGTNADWSIRISSAFINRQIVEQVRETLPSTLELVSTEIRYRGDGFTRGEIFVYALARTVNLHCDVGVWTTLYPHVGVDGSGRQFLQIPYAEPSTSPTFCAALDLFFSGGLAVASVGPSSDCRDVVGGELAFQPFVDEVARPALAAQRFYASDVLVDDLWFTQDPADGIFQIAGRVSTIDSIRQSDGMPRSAVPPCV